MSRSRRLRPTPAADALGLLLYIEFDGGNRTIYRCVGTEGDACQLTNPSDPAADSTCTPVDDLQQSLGLLQNPGSQGDAIRDGMVLLGFLAFFRVLVYLALRRKTARR